MRLFRTSVIATLALVFSTLAPISLPASATDGTFTDTVTVTDHNGAPLADAYVALNYWDDTSFADRSDAAVQTDSSGVAHVTGNNEKLYWGIAVTPAEGDTDNAAFTYVENMWGHNVDTSVSIQLRQANTLIHITNPDGTDAEVGSQLWYSSSADAPGAKNTQISISRPGAFGIDLNTHLVPSDAGSLMDVRGPGELGGNAGFNQFFMSNTSDGELPNVFSDPNQQNAVDVDDSGALVLPLAAASLAGSITSGNSAWHVPSGVRVLARVLPADESGNPQYSWDSRRPVLVNTDGTFTAYLPSYAPGKYFVQFRISGSATIPTFFGHAFYINDQGQLSNDASSGFQNVADFHYDQELTTDTPNVVFQATLGGSDLPVSFGLGNDRGFDLSPLTAANGLVAYRLPSGTFHLHISTTNSTMPPRDMDISVSPDGVASVNEFGRPISAVAGVFPVTFHSTNFTAKVSTPTGGAILPNACVSLEVRLNNGGYGAGGACGGNTPTGDTQFGLADGTYIVHVSPQDIRYSNSTYTLTLANGVATVTDTLGNPLGNTAGVFLLPGSTPNMLGSLLGPDGQPLNITDGGTPYICPEKWNGNGWDYFDCTNSANDGQYSVSVSSTGRYRLRYGQDDNPDYAMAYSADINVTDLSSTVTVPSIRMKASQVKVRVTNGGSGPLPGSQLEILDSHGNFLTWANTNWRTVAGLAFPAAGSYTLVAHAGDGSNLSTRYAVTVTDAGNGTLVPAIAGATANDDGTVTVAMASANVTGRLLDPSNNPWGDGATKQAGIELQKADGNGNWQWANNYVTSRSDGTFGMAVQEAGTFRLRISPNGDSAVSTTYSGSFTIADNQVDSFTRDFGDINLAVPNVRLKVKNPTTQAYTTTYCMDIQQNFGGRWQYADSTCDAALANFSLADGTYELHVNVRGFASKSYSMTIASGAISALTSNGVAATYDNNGHFFAVTSAVPNVSGNIVDVAGNPLGGSNGFACVNLQRLNNNGDWEWGIGTCTDASGNFGLSLDTAGTYRVRVEPRNGANGAVTLTEPFDVADPTTFTRTFASIQLAAPNVRIAIVDPATGVPIQGSYFNIFGSDGRYLQGGGIDNSAIGLTLADGSYQVEVNPNRSGLTQKRYNLTIANQVATVQGVAAVGGVFNLLPATPNVTGRVLDSSGQVINGLNGGANVQLQKWNSASNNWEWQPINSQVNADSTFGLSVTDPGHYRLKLNVSYGLAGSTSTYSDAFDVTGGQPIALGDLQLSAPNLQIQVSDPNTHQNLTTGWVNLFKSTNGVDMWMDGGGLNNGAASFSLPVGTYRLEVNPGTATLTAKSYTITVAASNGHDVATVSGATKNGNVYALSTGIPNLTGQVKSSTGGTLSLNNGRWLSISLQKYNSQNANWDWTNVWAQPTNNGGFALSVPTSGRFRLRVEPIGIADSAVAYSQPFDVSANDLSTLSLTFNDLRLTAPNFQLNIVDPRGGSANLSSPNVSIIERTTNRWVDGKGGNQSTFGFNLPDGSYIAQLNPNAAGLSSKNYDVTVANGVASVSGATADGSGIFQLAASLPNISGRLLDLSGAALAGSNGIGVNVQLQKKDDWGNWQYASNTNIAGDGTFGLNATTTGVYRVHVDVWGRNDITATNSAQFSVTDLAAQITVPNVQMLAPNLTFTMVDPNSHAALTSAWSDVFKTSDNGDSWVDSRGTNSGSVSFNLTVDGTYRVNVHPNAPGLSDKSYNVTVTNGVVTVAGATGTSGSITLAAALPNVTATVQSPSGGNAVVPGTWVNVNLQKQNGSHGWDWTNTWANVAADGSLSLNVAVDGTYRLRIQPNGSSTSALTFSQTFTVSGGALNELGTIRLNAPNLTFTLKDPSGHPVANANVGVGLSNWNTNATSDANGKIALFVGVEDIVSTNNWATNAPNGSQQLRVWIDPPYGSTDIVRWDCGSGDSKPVCDQLPGITVGTPFPQTDLGDVAFATPNLHINVKDAANASVGANSWVTIYKLNCDVNNNCWRQWLMGSNTGSNGSAPFNLTDTTGKFAVEVNAPYNRRTELSQTLDDNGGVGYTFAELNNLSVALKAPNLKLYVRQSGASGLPSKWSWLGVQALNSNGYPTTWIGGYGTDEFGFASLNLADGHYQLNINPGQGAGVQTFCKVTVASGEVTLDSGSCTASTGTAATGLYVKLSAGNLTGVVSAAVGAAPVAGAVVIATGSSGGTAQAISDTDGSFGFQLDANQTWTLKVVYLNPDPLAAKFASKTTGSISVGGASVSISLDPEQ